MDGRDQVEDKCRVDRGRDGSDGQISGELYKIFIEINIVHVRMMSNISLVVYHSLHESEWQGTGAGFLAN